MLKYLTLRQLLEIGVVDTGTAFCSAESDARLRLSAAGLVGDDTRLKVKLQGACR